MSEALRSVGLVTHDAAFRRVLAEAVQAAPANLPVLIEGESGTGKERVAELIHKQSGRSGAFVPINVAALPEPLIESELFGHSRGAFTGAVEATDGLFVAANRGTLFLDEVGELAPHIQVKLLRVLQEKEVQRLGDGRRRDVDVRVVSATHQDLVRLRQDFFYRIAGVRLKLPPLRERRSDIRPLLEYFLARCAAVAKQQAPEVLDEAWETLLTHAWPGNVRELEIVAERLQLACSQAASPISSSMVRRNLQVPVKEQTTGAPLLRSCLAQVLRELFSGSDWSPDRVTVEKFRETYRSYDPNGSAHLKRRKDIGSYLHRHASLLRELRAELGDVVLRNVITWLYHGGLKHDRTQGELEAALGVTRAEELPRPDTPAGAADVGYELFDFSGPQRIRFEERLVEVLRNSADTQTSYMTLTRYPPFITRPWAVQQKRQDAVFHGPTDKSTKHVVESLLQKRYELWHDIARRRVGIYVVVDRWSVEDYVRAAQSGRLTFAASEVARQFEHWRELLDEWPSFQVAVTDQEVGQTLIMSGGDLVVGYCNVAPTSGVLFGVRGWCVRDARAADALGAQFNHMWKALEARGRTDRVRICAWLERLRRRALEGPNWGSSCWDSVTDRPDGGPAS